jgi:SseB protein N-terminal domain
MDDDLVHEDFAIPYPLCVLLEQDDEAPSKDEVNLNDEVTYTTIKGDDGHLALPVFTNLNLAERFVDKENLDVAIAYVDNPSQFLDVLHGARSAIQKVIFDPETAWGWSRRVWDIAYVINRVQTALE